MMCMLYTLSCMHISMKLTFLNRNNSFFKMAVKSGHAFMHHKHGFAFKCNFI